MYLSAIRIFNYKSFMDSGDITLKPGINVIVGQNNSGKSSILNVLTFNFNDTPHESIHTKPRKDISLYESSVATFEVIISPTELAKIMQEQGSLAIKIPDKYFIDDIVNSSESYQDDIINQRNNLLIDILNWVNSQLEKDNRIIGTYDTRDNKIVELYLELIEVDTLPDQHWKPRDNDRTRKPYLLLSGYKNGVFSQIILEAGGAGLPHKTLNRFFGDIFKFDAKRIDLETSLPVEGLKLNSDCSNLAGVITNLLAERSIFNEYIELLTSVLPPVKDIFTKRRLHESGIGFEYLLEVSPYDSDIRRSDLAKSLTDCGTGIGQVLALLFVIVTSETPRVILIDELQSFLHPGAVKKLLEIFNKSPIKHQYILTTHSPEVLNNSHPANVILVNIENGVSNIAPINISNSNDIQQVFNNLGMKLSDYYFKHNLLWLEGETEKGIVPLLLNNRDDISLMVIESGIIYKKRKGGVRLACDLVKKISVGENIPNRNVFIIFDKEVLTQIQANELKEIAGNILHFLPRRMTENYLLHAKSISGLLNEIVEENIVDEKMTSDWIEAKFAEGWLDLNKKVNDLSKEKWLEQVHGANLLHEFFNENSQARCDYKSNKRQYGVELTKRILEHEPTFLDDLKDFYNSFI